MGKREKHPFTRLQQTAGSAGNTAPKQETNSVYKARWFRTFVATVAAVAILTGMGIWWFFTNRPAPAMAPIAYQWDTVSTRNGQKISFKLSDSSTIHLNAMSKIRYQVPFTGAQRVVELIDGEALFEVAKDSAMPFIVHCQGQQVKVLGTQFNIKAYQYNKERAIITTLLEGSVQINDSSQQKVLKPGQSCLNTQGELSIMYDNLSDITAWKNNLFSFHNKRLSEIMSEVCRWYNMEVIYSDPLQDIPFTIMEHTRNAPIVDLLSDLAASGLINFKIVGSKVYISKPG